MDCEIQKSKITSSKIKADIFSCNIINNIIKKENIALDINHQEMPLELITSGKITE